MDEEMCYIYPTEYYSAIKRKKILPFETTWMDLKDIMGSKILQAETYKYCMASLLSVVLRKRKKKKKSNS